MHSSTAMKNILSEIEQLQKKLRKMYECQHEFEFVSEDAHGTEALFHCRKCGDEKLVSAVAPPPQKASRDSATIKSYARMYSSHNGEKNDQS